MKPNVKKVLEKAHRQRLAYIKRELARNPPTKVSKIAEDLKLTTQRIYQLKAELEAK